MARQILAEEIADTPPTRRNEREAQLFRLVIAFDDLMPSNAANRVWDGLTAEAQQQATAAIRQVLLENGGEIHGPMPRTSRSVHLTPAQARILADVRRDGERRYNGLAKKAIEALENAGLVVVAWDHVPVAKGSGIALVQRITVRPR